MNEKRETKRTQQGSRTKACGACIAISRKTHCSQFQSVRCAPCEAAFNSSELARLRAMWVVNRDAIRALRAFGVLTRRQIRAIEDLARSQKGIEGYAAGVGR